MLVGRSRELSGLSQLLDAAALGRGGLRVLYGEAGIGKTRLCDELAARALERGFVVSWGRAAETGGAPAYFPWLELLAALRLSPPPRVRALLDGQTRAPLGERVSADPERERFELFEAVSAYLRACAAEAPLVLLFDDVHSADVASLELLCFLARGIRSSRIAVVCTARDVEARLPRVADVLARLNREGEVLALRPLSSEDVAEVVRHEVGRFDGALATALHQLTDGNPLFLRETLHAVATSARPVSVDALRDVSALGGVLALVRARLSDADPSLRAHFEVAAALGREVSLPLLADVAGVSHDAALAVLEEGVVRGLFVRRGALLWAFAHVLVREAFYRELALERQRALHAAIAAVLRKRIDHGSEELWPALAHHALLALPNGDLSEALRIAQRAADRARAQLGYEEAVAVLERALAACEAHGSDDRARAETLLALGWASTEAGRLARGRELFRAATEAARRIGDARLLARAALGQGGEYVLAEIRDELVNVLREAIAALEGDVEVEARRLHARVLARLAAALTPNPRPQEPHALALAALAMIEGESDARTRNDVDVGVGAAFAEFAPARERIPVNERLLRGAREVGDQVLELRALTRLSCDYIERGDLARAEATGAARNALAQAIGHPRYLWQIPLMRSMRSMIDGDFDACESAITEARALAAVTVDPNTHFAIEMHRFTMLLAAGRLADLRGQLPLAMRAFDRLPSGSEVSTWATATLAARSGDYAAAREGLRALGTVNALTSRFTKLISAESAVLCGEVELAAQLCASFDPDDDSNAGFGSVAFVCAPPVARVLAIVSFALGRSDDGERQFELALSVTQRMRAPAHEAWVRLSWGEALVAARRDPARAREQLQAALQLGERLVIPDLITRARAALDGAGAQPAATGATAARTLSAAPAAPAFALQRAGEHWSIEHAGRAFRLKDMRGLGMLARLIDEPEREFAALDLATDSLSETGGAIDLGDSGEVLDPRARAEYAARAAELASEIEEAESFADTGRAERLRAEREALTDQLAAAIGLGGRARRTGSAVERARVTVQRRIRDAIKKIGEHDPELARHLDWTVRTGAFCAYEPQGRKPGR